MPPGLKLTLHLLYSRRYGQVAGAVTVYAMNLDKVSTVTIVPYGPFKSTPVFSYNMHPTDGTLTSPYVDINGVTMNLVNDTLPVIPPLHTDHIVLKPLTFGFFVLPKANAAACI